MDVAYRLVFFQSKGDPFYPLLIPVHEVNQYTLASHLFWAIWGLTQAKNSLIDFDYFDYSLKRLQIYSNTKAAMLSPSLSGYLSHN